MLKGELKQINLIEECNEGILCLDKENKISFSNKGAQKILNNDNLNDKTLTELNLAKVDEITRQRTATKLKLNNQNMIALTSPSFDNGEYLGTTVFLLDSNTINKATCHQMYLSKTNKKKTFTEIRRKILIALSAGKKTINQISLDTNINWKTVEKHLTFLLGKRFIEEVYHSEYLRIFDLDTKGREKVTCLKEEAKSKLVSKA